MPSYSGAIVHTNKHHPYPRSRWGKLRHKLAKRWNEVAETAKKTVEVDVKLHNLYHALFLNMTPMEILEYLTEIFWQEKYTAIKCRNQDFSEVENYIIENSRHIVPLCTDKAWPIYCQFFFNMSPTQVVKFLNETFWDNQYDIIIFKKIPSEYLNPIFVNSDKILQPQML